MRRSFPDKAWQDLRTLPARYQGYYPCTAGHPYHAAVSGLFAFSPRQLLETPSTLRSKASNTFNCASPPCLPTLPRLGRPYET